MTSDSVRWISLNAALQHAVSYCHSPVIAKERIRNLLESGEIAGRSGEDTYVSPSHWKDYRIAWESSSASRSSSREVLETIKVDLKNGQRHTIIRKQRIRQAAELSNLVVPEEQVHAIWPARSASVHNETGETSKAETTSRYVPHADLKDYLVREADGKKTKPTLRSLADIHFEGRRITVQAFNQAWLAVPDHQKRQRGETDKTLRSKPRR